MNNILLHTDSYKASHFLQYPEGTTSMYSYLESRGGRYDRILFFGLQYILKEYLSRRITDADVEEARVFWEQHGEPFPEEGFRHIVKNLGGRIPLRIRAVAEGSIVPTHQVLMTVESTDPKTFWTVTYFETMLMRVWYPITVATQSWHIKQLIRGFLEKTADAPEAELGFKLHDFGGRGVSSHESAGIGAMSHIVNFLGSDTVEGIQFARRYYNAHKMPAFSIPAAEHSTITSWGKDGELAAYQNMLRQFAKPGSLVAVVSDSYDLDHAIREYWGKQLREEVIKSGATVVIRPDSGDPPEVVLRSLKALDDAYGHRVNSKGFRVLNNVRVIQGDGINEETIALILVRITASGYSTTNVAFGMGGALLQKLDRDTQKFAYKCSSITVNGQPRDVFKSPVDDPGKRSRGGKLDLIRAPNGEWRTIKGQAPADSLLDVVYLNGEIRKEYTFDQVRARSNEP
jgi:nicotinamide phosphoribosyltransferase